MRFDKVFVLGAVTGALSMWLWGRQIGERLEAGTRDLRTAAADRIQAVEETLRPGDAPSA